MKFEKIFIKYSKTQYMQKQWKMFVIKKKWNSLKKDDIERFIKEQSKLAFNGFHISFTNYDNFFFEKTKFFCISLFT